MGSPIKLFFASGTDKKKLLELELELKSHRRRARLEKVVAKIALGLLDKELEDVSERDDAEGVAVGVDEVETVDAGAHESADDVLDGIRLDACHGRVAGRLCDHLEEEGDGHVEELVDLVRADEETDVAGRDVAADLARVGEEDGDGRDVVVAHEHKGVHEGLGVLDGPDLATVGKAGLLERLCADRAELVKVGRERLDEGALGDDVDNVAAGALDDGHTANVVLAAEEHTVEEVVAVLVDRDEGAKAGKGDGLSNRRRAKLLALLGLSKERLGRLGLELLEHEKDEADHVDDAEVLVGPRCVVGLLGVAHRGGENVVRREDADGIEDRRVRADDDELADRRRGKDGEGDRLELVVQGAVALVENLDGALGSAAGLLTLRDGDGDDAVIADGSRAGHVGRLRELEAA
eukprot:m.284804 g.284804  ORF g.284804 m.284804 type:complete len:407 (+) comp11232_c0_seq1:495-1715(+)